jgi:pimeloyl-ACP methyl ester carboxylesterase
VDDQTRFKTDHGSEIAYYYRPGAGPTVVFCGGFMSNMNGTKASFLETHCLWKGYGYLRFDYSGHGQSSGRFEDGTVGLWTKDAEALIKGVTEGPIILVGSSMGGWIALLVALRIKDRLKGLIGIAAAPDATDKIMWSSFSDEIKARIETEGRIELPSDYDDSPYIITKTLIDEGRNHLLLDGPIDLDVPVRLIHGMMDKDVPFEFSHRIADRLTTDNVEICFVKGGDHSLTTPADIRRLNATLDNLVLRVSEKGR